MLNFNSTLQDNFIDFLEMENNGNNKQYFDLIEKIDRKTDFVKKHVSKLKTTLDTTIFKLDGFTSRKKIVFKLRDETMLRKSKEIEKELISQFYDCFLVSILNVDEECTDRAEYDRLFDNCKAYIMELSDRRYAEEGLSNEYRNLIKKTQKNCMGDLKGYYEQTSDIFVNTQNGTRKKIISKHIKLMKHMAERMFSKEYWKIIKEDNNINT